MEKVKFLNQKLARQYTGHGGTWEFAILKETSGRQYIQVTESGSASILECWYWASVDKVEPDKVKRITAGHSMEVVQLATFITLGGGLIYLFIRILARWIL